VLGDLELDAALPLAGLGALLRRAADERRRRVLLVEILEDGDRLAQTRPSSSSSAGTCPPGFLSVYGARRFSAPRRSTSTFGSSSAFSCRYMRSARGFGPKES